MFQFSDLAPNGHSVPVDSDDGYAVLRAIPATIEQR
jgi:hypothetical protein